MTVDRDVANSLFNLLAERWENALRTKNYKEATDVAMAADLVFRGDAAFANIGLLWLSVIHKQTSPEADQPSDLTCSFCAQEKKPEELIDGVAAKICRGCVENISRHIAGKS
jgi:hypothetical protein